MPARILWQAGALEPVGQILDKVMLLDPSGPKVGEQGTPFYEITFVEPIVGIGGPHGLLLLWAQTAAPAGYTLPGGSSVGTIGIGNAIKSTPNTFVMRKKELLQFRFMLKAVGTLPAGWAVDDLDLQVFLPGAVARWAVQNDNGRWNMMWQAALPGDNVLDPAQGANIVQPSSMPLVSPPAGLISSLTEFFVYEADNQPVWQLTNNGSVAMNSAMAIGLHIFGFRYTLRPLKLGEGGGWVPTVAFGQPVSVPGDWNQQRIVIPITGIGASQ